MPLETPAQRYECEHSESAILCRAPNIKALGKGKGDGHTHLYVRNCLRLIEVSSKGSSIASPSTLVCAPSSNHPAEPRSLGHQLGTHPRSQPPQVSCDHLLIRGCSQLLANEVSWLFSLGLPLMRGPWELRTFFACWLF